MLSLLSLVPLWRPLFACIEPMSRRVCLFICFCYVLWARFGFTDRRRGQTGLVNRVHDTSSDFCEAEAKAGCLPLSVQGARPLTAIRLCAVMAADPVGRLPDPLVEQCIAFHVSSSHRAWLVSSVSSGHDGLRAARFIWSRCGGGNAIQNSSVKEIKQQQKSRPSLHRPR